MPGERLAGAVLGLYRGSQFVMRLAPGGERVTGDRVELRYGEQDALFGLELVGDAGMFGISAVTEPVAGAVHALGC